MRFISSMAWVKKGVSKTPVRIKIDENEMKQLFSEMGANNEEDDDESKSEGENISEHEDNISESGNEEANIDKKYNLDNYDDEG